MSGGKAVGRLHGSTGKYSFLKVGLNLEWSELKERHRVVNKCVLCSGEKILIRMDSSWNGRLQVKVQQYRL